MADVRHQDCQQYAQQYAKGRRASGVVSMAVVAGLLAPPATAALVENLTMGNAKALALGNAVTADPPGIDSIHFNPAGLARLAGRQYELKVLAAAMSFTVEFGEHDAKSQQMIDAFGYEDDVVGQTSETSTIGLRLPYQEGIYEWPAPMLVVPLGGASYRPPNSNITFATAVYAPMAAGYIRDEDDPARFMGQYLSLAKITYFSPSVGIEINDTLSVGAAIHFSWQGVTAGTRIRVPNFALAFGEQLTKQLQDQNLCPNPGDPEPPVNLCGIDQEIARLGPYTDAASLEFDAETGMVTGVNLGVLWQPVSWVTWGAVYQFESSADLDGTYRLGYSDEWVNFFTGLSQSDMGRALNVLIPMPTGQADSPYGRGVEQGDAVINVITPAHFATGISLQVTEQWKFNMDAKWTDWGAWDGLTVKFDQALDFTKLASIVSEYSELTELTIPRHYASVWNWAFGAEYQYNQRLALRFGYEPRKSSIPDDKQDVLLPLGDADLYTGGFEYKMGEGQLLAVGVGYLVASADVPANSSTNANSTDDYHNFIYNPYAGTAFESSAEAFLLELSYRSQF